MPRDERTHQTHPPRAKQLPRLSQHSHALGRQRHVRPCQQRRLLQLVRHGGERAAHRARALDIHQGQTIGFVVETQCNYFAPIAFPQTVEAGIRVAQAGRSSVRYEIALFAQGCDTAAAQGHFVHVYVDRATHRPVPLPEALQQVVDSLKA
jgi:acyl-CoA thioesterase FadM